MAGIRYKHKRKEYYLEPREFAYVYHYARMYDTWCRAYDTLVNSQTEPEALRLAAIREKMESIEQSAIEADGDLCQWIMIAATQGRTWPQLYAEGIPCERATYYRKRRKFYYCLYQRLEIG